VSYRELDPFRVADCGPDELAYAVKCAHQRRPPQDLSHAIDAFTEMGRRGGWFTEAHLRWIAAGSTRPIKYVRAEFAEAQRWLASIGDWLAAYGEIDSAGQLIQKGLSTAYVRGLPTFIVQAGQLAAYKAMMVTHGILAGGHNVIIKTTTHEPLSTYLFARACLERRLSVPQIVHVNAQRPENRNALERAIFQCKQSICFGEDETIGRMYGGARWDPDHRVAPFWTGRSGAIVLPDADLEATATHLVRGMISLGRGDDCTATKRVLVPEGLAADLQSLLVDRLRKLVIGPPLDETTDACPDEAQHDLARRFFHTADLFYDEGAILAWCAPTERVLREELPYPTLALQRYRANDDPAALADRHVADTPSGRAVSTSVFTRDEARFREVAATIASDKVVWNRPSSILDFAQQHSGNHLCFAMMRWREIVT
jgi:hypothetical protein